VHLVAIDLVKGFFDFLNVSVLFVPMATVDQKRDIKTVLVTAF
jgi:hypothetical protein